MDALVDYQLDGGIATVTMDDGKANVMSVQMLLALNKALDRAQSDQAVVLLAGRPGMFSGGFDLSVFKRDPEEQMRMLELGALLTERLLSFPRPVVAACTGHAIAMGAFLLLSADVRIGVDQGARIQVNEVQIGMTLPRFAIEVSRQRLSPAHLNIALATAEPYSPADAVVAGFLDAIVPAATIAAAARDRATRLVTLHAEAFTATRLRLRRSTLVALREAIREDTLDWAARIRKA
jgi:enoyl-CoA hydratase